MTRLWPLLLLVAALFRLDPQPALAQSPQFVPAYPLYCHGPLNTSTLAGRETTTPFKWAAASAGSTPPGPGQCVWADRPARGDEIQAGGNAVCDYSDAMRSVPAGIFVEIGVARDPLSGNCMHLIRYVGAVSPPFSGTPALAPFVRQSVATLSAAQIASFRHGIQMMMSRPATDPTSFTFQANIHGTYDNAATAEQMLVWNNCEHGSYFFLSWHRMYLYFFDRILRAASGDSNLVLPYWDWTDPTQRSLPAPFRLPANASNPLYIAPPNRPAGLDAGTAILGANTVSYSGAFGDVPFDSPVGSGASFGGQIASPMHFNAPHGAFESQPHDVVHVALGGLMSDPNTAAQDPIFWLHHANIDRMWGRWLAQGGGRADPGDAAWLDTRFTFYDEAGHAVYLTGAEVINTAAQLNYRYDDMMQMQMQHIIVPHPVLLAMQGHAAPFIIASIGTVPHAQSTQPVPVESAAHPITLAGQLAHVQVPVDAAAFNRMRMLMAGNRPRKIILRLNDIRYDRPGSVYYEVYVDPPKGQTLDPSTPGYVGNLSLFGLKPHTMPGHPAMPANDVYVDYDVSQIVRQAPIKGSLSITLVPRGLFDMNQQPLPVQARTQGTIGLVQIVSP